jgi:GT2 family glycosyltransferase/glycosyltransferase involved in cell wall biosynthesis
MSDIIDDSIVNCMSTPRCEIIIPVFNGFEKVTRCIASVIALTPPDCVIRVLDDASTDLRLLTWLTTIEQTHAHVSVSRSDENLGFVGNVNRGLRSAGSDVIVLNSDTVVTANWVDKLIACAASDPKIALVCPLSNNATLVSVPVMNWDNRVPDGMSIARFGELVDRCSIRCYPRLPVVVGFCMLIRLWALQRLGDLHLAYHRGYGEECDYSLRAWEAGYEIACCDDAFVYHEGEQSFGAVTGMSEVKRRNASVLLARWPFYNRLIQRFCHANPLRDVQERIATGLCRARGDTAPHLLQVLHSYHALGGTELHSRSIVEGVAEDFRTTVIFPGETGSDERDFQSVSDHEWFRVFSYRRAHVEGAPRLCGHVASLRHAVVEASFTRLVAGGQVALVHFQHLLDWGTLELPVIAKRLGASVLLSLHDYYLFCPIFDMLRPEGMPCGKASANADDPECLRCLAHYARADATGGTLHDYLVARRDKLLEVFQHTDALISPSLYVKEKFTDAYGPALASKIRVMTHGISIPGKVRETARQRPFRLGVFANLTRRKGAGILLEAIAHLATRRRIDIWHFGGIEDCYTRQLDAAGVHRSGVYRPDELRQRAAGVDLALVPSVYEETFCLTITELQALGIPVIAFAVGAIVERIQDEESGFLVRELTAQALARRIDDIVADPAQLRHVRSGLRGLTIKSIAANVREYSDLYGTLIAGQPVNESPCSAGPPMPPDGDRAPEPTDMSAAFLAAVEPTWGRFRAAYGTPRYRQWVETLGRGEFPCVGVERTAFSDLDLVVLEHERHQGAIAATLRSVSAGASTGVRVLVVSFFDPPESAPADAVVCVWMKIERTQQPSRIINRWLKKEGADWIGWLMAGDELHPSALASIQGYLAARLDWKFIYTDEDLMAEDGRRYRPRFKPDLNLELLRCQAYIGDLCLIARDAFIACGGLAPYASAALYDLCFKVIDRYGELSVGHLPQVLYHRADRSGLLELDDERHPGELEKVIAAHLARNRMRGLVCKTGTPGIYWVDYPPPRDPLVSLIVMTDGDGVAVGQLIDNFRSVLDRFEVLVLDFQHKGVPGKGLKTAVTDVPIRTLRAESRDNLAHSLTRAIRLARSKRVLVTHDGIRIRQQSALSTLLNLIARPDVALAGPCILDETGNILQSYPVAGFWPLGATGQLHRGQTLAGRGYLDRNLCAQNCVSVSDHLFALWKPAFDQAGGFNGKDYPTAWYMLDLGLRLSGQGGRVVWTPHATVVETDEGSIYRYRRLKLRDLNVASEVARLYTQWLPRLANDPAYNRNLSLRDSDCEPDVQLGRAWDPVLCTVPRLLGLPGDLSGSGHYRVIDPLQALHEQKRVCHALLPEHRSARAPSVVELERLAPHTLLLHNALHDQHLHALELYRHYSHIRLVFSLDDLMTDLPDWNPFRQSNYPDIDRRLNFVLERCDRLLLSTQALADAYATRHGDLRVIPNRLAGSRWRNLTAATPSAAPVRGKPRIGWAGAAQHQGDLAWLAPVVEALAGEVEWVFLGMCPEALKPFATVELAMVDFARYPSVLAQLGLSVAIAPLALHDFNRCKSNVKLLEYGILGIPVVCTDIEPYRNAPVERAANRPERWIDALRARIADPDGARREGAELRRWVESGWMLEDALDQWLTALT